MKKTIAVSLALLMILLSFSGCKKAVGVGSDYLEYDSYYYVGGENDNTTTGNAGDSSVQAGGASDTAGSASGTASGSSTKTTGGKSGQSASAITTSEQLASDQIPGIPKSLKNPKITLMSWYDPGSEDSTTAFYWAIKKYEELYGKGTTELVLTSSADGYKEKLVARMAGGDTPECMEVKTEWMPSFASEKIVQPIDGIIDYTKLHYQGLITATSSNGKHYVAVPNGMWSTVIWYNKTLFNKWGVKTPAEYYDENAWTWDNFEKAACEMTGNGVWGYATQNADTLVRSQPTGFVSKDKNGKMYISWNSPEVMNALQKTYDMIYKDKCWNPDLSYFATNFKKGKVAMSSGVIGFIQNYCGGMTDEIDCVPLPKPDAKSDYYAGAYGIFWALGYGCKNKEAATSFFKILAYYEEKDYGNRTPLERILTDRQLEITRGLSNKAGTVLHLSLSSWNANIFWKSFVTDNKPVATILAENQNELQKAINAVQ